LINISFFIAHPRRVGAAAIEAIRIPRGAVGSRRREKPAATFRPWGLLPAAAGIALLENPAIDKRPDSERRRQSHREFDSPRRERARLKCNAVRGRRHGERLAPAGTRAQLDLRDEVDRLAPSGRRNTKSHSSET